jgi:hypothetical protein
MTHDISALTESPVDLRTPDASVELAALRILDEPRWDGGNPAGAIELTDAELRDALQAKPICSENASISTTWCDNPKVC